MRVKILCQNCYCISEVNMYDLGNFKTIVECPICQAAHIWKTRLKRHPEMVALEEE